MKTPDRTDTNGSVTDKPVDDPANHGMEYFIRLTLRQTHALQPGLDGVLAALGHLLYESGVFGFKRPRKEGLDGVPHLLSPVDDSIDLGDDGDVNICMTRQTHCGF